MCISGQGANRKPLKSDDASTCSDAIIFLISSYAALARYSYIYISQGLGYDSSQLVSQFQIFIFIFIDTRLGGFFASNPLSPFFRSSASRNGRISSKDNHPHHWWYILACSPRLFKQRLTPTQQTAVSVLNSPPNSSPAALTMCSWGHALCKKAARRFTHCNHRATQAQSNLSIWTSQTIAHSPLLLLPCRRAMGGWICLLTMRRSAVVLGV